MPNEAVRSAIAQLISSEEQVNIDNIDSAYRANAAAYERLCAHIEAADSDLKPEIGNEIRAAIQTCPKGSLGFYFLDAALARVLVMNISNWIDLGTDALIPSPSLISGLQERVEFANQHSSPFLKLYQGMEHFITGNDVAAYQCFFESKQHPLYWSAIRDDFKGSATCLPFPKLGTDIDYQSPFDLRTAETRFPEPTGELEWLLRPDINPELFVISFSCDDLYFRAFAPFILDSLPTECPGLNIHFHVVNLGESSRELVKELARAAEKKRCNLIVSFEHTEAKDRAYFACARFIRLHEFLDAFQTPVLLIDSDSEFTADPREWKQKLDPDAVNMLFVKGPWDGGFLPWRAVWGGMVYVPPTKEGNYFAKVLQAVIGYLWNSNSPSNWWIDQNALYLSYKLLQRYWGTDGFRNIRPEVYRHVLTSEDLKVQRLKSLPEVAALIAKGADWKAALHEVQLRNQ